MQFTIETVGSLKRIVVKSEYKPQRWESQAVRRLRWGIAICTLDLDAPIMGGDVDALYQEAVEAGRPLTKEEAMALLLARRLTAN